jgi:hypothetical protein
MVSALSPLLHSINGIPYQNFPNNKQELFVMSGVQLSAALAYYNLPHGGNRSIKLTRFTTFIGIV